MTTKQTIIRHLKGIVAALEKDEKDTRCSHDKKTNGICDSCGKEVFTWRT